MRAGAFYSSEDADSEGLEGKFYIWTRRELLDLLGDSDGKIVAEHFGASDIGNWLHPGDAHVPRGPKNILHVSRSAETIAKVEHLDVAGVEKIIADAKLKLFEEREKRVRPGLDDKVLSGWNGLMITALAKAAAVLDEPRYREAAERAADFILETMCPDGRLLATYGKGRARLNGYITDYAFFIEGLLELYQAGGDLERLAQARRLTAAAVEYYWDEAAGGFFFTASDHENLLVRGKTANDGAIPSGNSVMLGNLLKLNILLDQADSRHKAEQIIRIFAGSGAMRTPFQHERLLAGVEAFHEGFAEIAVIGPPGDPATKALLEVVYSRYLPNKVVARFDPADQELPKNMPLLQDRALIDGKPAAYVCRDFVCREPVTNPEELAKQLWPPS